MKKETIFICSFVIILMTSISAVAQQCMFVCADDTVRATELNITQKLEEWGYTVTPVQSSVLADLTEDDYADYDLIFASESVNSTSLAPLKTIPVPLVTTEAWASKPAALAWSDPASASNIAPEPVMIIGDTGDPLVAGYKNGDVVDLVEDVTNGLIIPTTPTIDVIYVCALESDDSKNIIYGIETGTELTDGYITENRAVCIGIHEYGYSSITEAGYALIQAAINWVTNTDPNAVEEISQTPADFSLAQNYPNPFNPTTEIQFSIEKSVYTNLTVYDALGRAVETLVDQELNAGKYNVTFNAATLPSGVYFYKIQSNGMNEVHKMILMK